MENENWCAGELDICRSVQLKTNTFICSDTNWNTSINYLLETDSVPILGVTENERE